MLSQAGDPQPEVSFSIIMYIALPLVGISFVVSAITMLGWSFQVATGLYKKLPADHTMKIKRYYFAFFYPMAYIAVFIICTSIFALVTINGAKTSPNEPPAFLAWMFLIIPFHFFAMACIFYTLYFNAKSLKSVELQRNATASEYTGEFVLMWFFMIGVFFIQPRINKIFAEENEMPVKDLSQA
jgi:hypothetical protein